MHRIRQRWTSTLLLLALALVLLGSVRSGEQHLELTSDLALTSRDACATAADDPAASCCCDEAATPAPAGGESCCSVEPAAAEHADASATDACCESDSFSTCHHCACTSVPAFSLLMLHTSGTLVPIHTHATQPLAADPTLGPGNTDGRSIDHIPRLG